MTGGAAMRTTFVVLASLTSGTGNLTSARRLAEFLSNATADGRDVAVVLKVWNGDIFGWGIRP